MTQNGLFGVERTAAVDDDVIPFQHVDFVVECLESDAAYGVVADDVTYILSVVAKHYYIEYAAQRGVALDIVYIVPIQSDFRRIVNRLDNFH